MTLRTPLDAAFTRFVQRYVGPRVPPRLDEWFYQALVHQRHIGARNDPITYYEFGVGGGATMSNFIVALERYCSKFRSEIGRCSIYGFDSFVGLPEKQSQKDDHPDWSKGALSYAQEVIKSRVALSRLPAENLHLIPGFYDQSLTPELQASLVEKKPNIVTIDCDYYSSTMQALQWLAPLLDSGTLFYFDDIWSFDGHPAYGELAAINEFNAGVNGYLSPFALIPYGGQAYIYAKEDFNS